MAGPHVVEPDESVVKNNQQNHELFISLSRSRLFQFRFSMKKNLFRILGFGKGAEKLSIAGCFPCFNQKYRNDSHF